MFLQNLISQRIDNNKPVKVALIGAGKFGSMFLSQVPTTPGLDVVIIADLIPDSAKKACKNVGWKDDLISNTEFVESGIKAITKSEVEGVVDKVVDELVLAGGAVARRRREPLRRRVDVGVHGGRLLRAVRRRAGAPRTHSTAVPW